MEGESSPWVTKGWMEADDKRLIGPLREADPQEGGVLLGEDRAEDPDEREVWVPRRLGVEEVVGKQRGELVE
jgi:hypothetical protein